MVAIGGGRQAEQGLQQALNVTGLQEVLAADYEADALPGVVDRHRQVIGDADILAGQDDVAGPPRVGGHLAADLIDEGEVAEAAQGLFCGADRQPPGERFAGREPPGLLVTWRRLAEERGLRTMGGAGDVGDLGPGAEAAVNQAAFGEGGEGGAIGLAAGRLEENRLLPDQTQPSEVVEDGFSESRLAARGVDILDAEQEAPGGGGVERLQGGVGVAAVQQSGRGRGEAADDVQSQSPSCAILA